VRPGMTAFTRISDLATSSAIELVMPSPAANLKPAFASVDEAFVVKNGKDLNRLEANALYRSRAFKRFRLRWPQRERGVADDVRASIPGNRSREYMCLSGKGALPRMSLAALRFHSTSRQCDAATWQTTRGLGRRGSPQQPAGILRYISKTGFNFAKFRDARRAA
jgi:hypothetical protein